MFRDRLAEGLAYLRIFGGELKRALGNADAARRHVDASEFQAAGRLQKTLPFFAADQVICRNAIVVEVHFGGIDRLVAQLLQLLSHGKAWSLGGDEQAHSLVSRLGRWISLDEESENRALDAVRNPGLGAVDDVGVAITAGRHANSLQIRSGVRLRQRKTAAHFSGSELRQPGQLLLRGAEFLDVK